MQAAHTNSPLLTPVETPAGKGKAHKVQQAQSVMNRARQGWQTCAAGQLWHTAHWAPRLDRLGTNWRRGNGLLNNPPIYSARIHFIT